MSSSPDHPVQPADQRVADQQIVELLRRSRADPASNEWRQLVRALLEYTYPVLVAWGVTGVLRQRVARCSSLSAARVPATLRLDEDDARTLAAEVLVVALPSLRSSGLAGWDPGGAVSLRSYFVNCCLRELGPVYYRWSRRGPGDDGAVTDATPEQGAVASHPHDQGEIDVPAEGWLDHDPVLQTVYELQQGGYKLTEIVEVLRSEDAPVTMSDDRSRPYRVPDPAEDPDD